MFRGTAQCDRSNRDSEAMTKRHIADRLRQDSKYIEGYGGTEGRRALMREAADYIDQLEQDFAQLTDRSIEQQDQPCPESKHETGI